MSEPTGIWWCNTHGREASYVNAKGEHTCPPHSGGIMIPCFAVFAPMTVVYPKQRRKPRSIRSRLVDHLLDAFTAAGKHAGIADDDLQPARGHWRTSPYADVYRWEAYIHLEDVPHTVHLVSWDTMTECVKRGVEVEWDPSILAWDVTAKSRLATEG